MPALDGVPASLMFWGLVLAALLLGACGAALAPSSRRRQQALSARLDGIAEADRRMREREARRARLSVALEPEIEVRWYLTIRNDGPGPARDLTISIDGTALEQSPMIDPTQLASAELGVVGAHRTLRIPLRTAGRPDELQLEVSWSDTSGEFGLYQTELSR
jgi:hypothetical protein